MKYVKYSKKDNIKSLVASVDIFFQYNQATFCSDGVEHISFNFKLNFLF